MSESFPQFVEFVEILNHNDYEILNIYPYTIRRKRDHYVISESVNGSGYICVALNGKSYKKHRLIAEQFLFNEDPENKKEVDHINHNRADYHIENLRWVSHSENIFNKTSHCGINYNYVDDIDGDSIVITDYGTHKFEEYYYDQTVDKFYFWNGIKYRELHINEMKNGLKFVDMKSTKGKRINVYYSKFKRLYGLV